MRWALIPGYAGRYEVSDSGEVRNLERNKRLKPHNTGKGYQQVVLQMNGARSYTSIHRLVASAFIPNPEGLPQVNHKNGDKADNRVANLEWCTMSENLRHRHQVLKQPGNRSKKVLCTNTGETFPSVKTAAAVTGDSRAGILRCCHGQQNKTRKHKYHFKFMED